MVTSTSASNPKSYKEEARHHGGLFGPDSSWKSQVLPSSGLWPAFGVHQLKAKPTGNKFSMNENGDRMEVSIEFIGHNLNASQVTAQVVNKDQANKTLLISVEDIGYEKKIALHDKHDIEAIITDFEVVNPDHQVLAILVPKFPTFPHFPVKPDSVIDQINDNKELEEQVDITDHVDRTEVKIEFIGHKLKKEHLAVQLVDQDTLVVKAEKGKQKYEKAFNILPNHRVDSIESKFKEVSKNVQVLTVIIPKEREIIDIPIKNEEDIED